MTASSREPRGFQNVAFEANQVQPVAASYADGQYWDDTSFPIPLGATYAVVSVYHQTSSKEYIEFLGAPYAFLAERNSTKATASSVASASHISVALGSGAL